MVILKVSGQNQTHTVVRAPIRIKENNTSHNDNGALSYADLVSQVGLFASVNENKSVGLNLELCW